MKNIIKIILVLSVIGLLFSGCNQKLEDFNTTDNISINQTNNTYKLDCEKAQTLDAYNSCIRLEYAINYS